MRLIDADILMPNAEYKGRYDVVTAYDIANAPTVELEPRKKGKWNRNGDIPKTCSVCGEDWDKYVEGQEIWYTGEIPNFCPNCGADMREPFTIPTEIIESVIGYDD